MSRTTLKPELLITIEDLRKYPFAPEALERIRSLGLGIADLASRPLRTVVERAASYVRSAINGAELPPPSDDCDEEVLAFALTLIVLKVIGDSMLTRRFALLFSKRTARFLVEEEVNKLIYILSTIGVKVKILPNRVHGYPLAIHVFSYVENLPERAGAWKLVHRLVENGWVYVNKFEAARIGEEALKKLIERRVEELKVDGIYIPDELAALIEALKSEWDSKVRKIRESWVPAASEGEASEDALPPCIRALLEDVKAGKNLPHSARFALASFLLNIGLSVEGVLNVFRSAPDFNEKIARYQVEHIAGMRGSGKKYTPYKCETMRTLGLCVADCGVKHPLQYYRLALRRVRKRGGEAKAQPIRRSEVEPR